MLELLWFLLPVAAASGWWVAQRNIKQSTHSVFDLSPDYYKGLNYLLNEEPDKAIDVFIQLLDVDSDTVETHLALGVLFRQRGEVNRALRIHQNLVARPRLNISQRHSAMLALAEDYLHAGLFDRAEEMYLQLTDTQYKKKAYQHLLSIYQQEQEWDKAIEVAEVLHHLMDKTFNCDIAHFYCEKAVRLQELQHYPQAFEAIEYALKQDPYCVRASLLKGDLALLQGQKQQAISAFKQVEQQDLSFLSEAIAGLKRCYEPAYKSADFIDYLHTLLLRYANINAALALVDVAVEQEDPASAADFLSQHLHKHPSIRGLQRLLELNILPAGNTGYIPLIQTSIEQLLKNKPIYQCSHCGFKGKSLHWQCPSCKQWNTIKPIQGIDGE